jgi:hypothetical protein
MLFLFHVAHPFWKENMRLTSHGVASRFSTVHTNTAA